MLNRLQQARHSLRGKKVQDMIILEENEAHLALAMKFKDKIQVDENFLVNMALANVKNWKDIWK
jgi:Ca2+-binding EF-hand superfamily protein